MLVRELYDSLVVLVCLMAFLILLILFCSRSFLRSRHMPKLI